MVVIKGKKKGIVEKKVWNKDYAKAMRVPHADIDFSKYMPQNDEKSEKLKKVKVIRRKRKEKKKDVL